jgi:hypothetical protein
MEERMVQAPEKGSEEKAGPTAPLEALSVREIVDQLESLVRYSLECENRPLREDVSFIEVYQQLLDIQKAITVLDKDQKDLIAKMSMASDILPENKPTVSPEDQKSLEKLKQLEQLCEEARGRLHASLPGQSTRKIREEIEETGISAKKKALRRKGKFKTVGGSGWVRS